MKIPFPIFLRRLFSVGLVSLLHVTCVPRPSPGVVSKCVEDLFPESGKNSNGWTDEKKKLQKLFGDPRLNSGHGRGPSFSL